MNLQRLNSRTRNGPGNEKRHRRLQIEVLEDRQLLTSLWQNPINALDVNNDSLVTSRDALAIINHISREGPGRVGTSNGTTFFGDTNGDEHVSSGDVLLVVNGLNAHGISQGSSALDPTLVDRLLGVHGEGPPIQEPPVSSATSPMAIGIVLVATCDSSESSKQQADFVGDCDGDQEEINLAIQSLPDIGGTVQLAEGTYNIRAVSGTLGGITIDKSNVVFQGRGTSTKLLLADEQQTNVIRIIGDGVADVTVRDLYINGNWTKNYCSTFECSGIFARKQAGAANPLHSITVENTFIEDSARLNIFLDAVNAKIINNHLGDAGSDSVEILTGPGIISDNYVEIDSETGYVFSTDQADGVTITNNQIWILPTGSISQSVIRTWGGNYRHIISDNQVYAQGEINRMLEVNGYINLVSNNLFANYNYLTSLSDLNINGASLIHDNVILGGRVVLSYDAPWASSVKDNLLLLGSTIEQAATGPILTHASNNVITP